VVVVVDMVIYCACVSGGSCGCDSDGGACDDGSGCDDGGLMSVVMVVVVVAREWWWWPRLSQTKRVRMIIWCSEARNKFEEAHTSPTYVAGEVDSAYGGPSEQDCRTLR
jgi:hypothetical protein